MKLKDLAETLSARACGPLDGAVDDLTHDSRLCHPGCLFVAISGSRSDGNHYVSDALRRGAVGVVSENPSPLEFPHAWFQVHDARLALALASAEIFGHPSRRMKLVGITGTNGKTTTAFLIDSMFKELEVSSAMIGTVTYRMGNEQWPADRTTPEAPDIHRFLSRARALGAEYAVMEVSSHALDLKRVYALEFAVAAFTNLTPEHLDYHGSMDQYFGAKRKLFEGTAGHPPKAVAINLDDPRADELLAIARSRSSQTLTFGFHEDAQVRGSGFTGGMSGLEFVAETPSGSLPVQSQLIGRLQVYNILAAVSVGLLLELDVDAMLRGIKSCRSVPGRFEIVDEGQDFAVVVDYAHTQDALKNVLAAARGLTPNRIITLFGCGGDRDVSKRTPMGEVVARLSDYVIVTSDNPRSEDPHEIISQIEVGLKRVGAPYVKIADRREAIQRAIGEARPGDLVLLAGKGHETTQTFKDRTIPFDDREVARQAILHRLKAGGNLGTPAVNNARAD